MNVAVNKMVSVSYTLRKDNENGNIVETVNKENPLSFIFGSGNLLKKFENNLEGLEVGSPFSFTLESEDAYGESYPDAIVELPKNIFIIEGEIQEGLLDIGNVIPMQDNQGNRMNGKVVAVSEETATLDFNHPLAGETLHFTGVVEAIRDASKEELEHNGHTCTGCGKH